MKISHRDRIKNKIKKIEPKRWWGDEFDVRFYLISKIHEIKNNKILDVGSGIGIMNSESDKSNFRVNVDILFNDLKTCHKIVDSDSQNVCASMTNLPFKTESFDVVICANVLEEAKKIDLKNQENSKKELSVKFPTVEKTLSEISRVSFQDGVALITTPNNAYYNTIKLSFDELENSIRKFFSNSRIFLYNTHRKLSKNRKFNMANIFPKFASKFSDPDKIINNLLKPLDKNCYSVSFFVEAEK